MVQLIVCTDLKFQDNGITLKENAVITVNPVKDDSKRIYVESKDRRIEVKFIISNDEFAGLVTAGKFESITKTAS